MWRENEEEEEEEEQERRDWWSCWRSSAADGIHLRRNPREPNCGDPATMFIIR